MSVVRLAPEVARAIVQIQGKLGAVEGADPGAGPPTGAIGVDTIMGLFEALEAAESMEAVSEPSEAGLLAAFCEISLELGPAAGGFARSVPFVYRRLCEIASRLPNNRDPAHDGPMETLLYTFGTTAFRGATATQMSQWREGWSSRCARASFERAARQVFGVRSR